MSTTQRRGVQLTAAISTIALLAACGGGNGGANPSASRPTLPQGSQPVKLVPADFSTTIDNVYLPLVPGTQMTYREIDTEGAETMIVLTVTDKTKKLANGITARVVRDTARSNGEIIEDTFDWYAQDKAGSVWYLGQDTAEFDIGKKISTSGSFEAGRDGALPGIAMPAKAHAWALVPAGLLQG